MKKKKIAVVDMETDPFKYGRYPEPFLIGVYDGDEYWTFTDVYELIDFLIPKQWIVYAHNGGKFDWHFILDFINEGDQLKIINGRLSSFQIGLCEFRDSYNILPGPLAAYKKDEVDYTLFEKKVRDLPENKAIIEAYLKTDCIYLYDLVSGFINQFGLHLTQATAALRVWEELSGRRAPESTREYYDEFYPFYFGGRVQCFHKGPIEHEFKVFDINSAYPFAMQSQHPFSLTYSIMSNPDWDCLDEEYGHCFFEILAVSKGALPKRAEDKSIYFPVDEIPSLYFCTGHELRAGLETKTLQLIEIRKIYKHNELADFTEYVQYFYQRRKELKLYLEIDPDHDESKRKLLFYKYFFKFPLWQVCRES